VKRGSQDLGSGKKGKWPQDTTENEARAGVPGGPLPHKTRAARGLSLSLLGEGSQQRSELLYIHRFLLNFRMLQATRKEGDQDDIEGGSVKSVSKLRRRKEKRSKK